MRKWLRRVFAPENQCGKWETYGINEYDAHGHRCAMARHHDGDHDFSHCPMRKK